MRLPGSSVGTKRRRFPALNPRPRLPLRAVGRRDPPARRAIARATPGVVVVETGRAPSLQDRGLVRTERLRAVVSVWQGANAARRRMWKRATADVSRAAF